MTVRITQRLGVLLALLAVGATYHRPVAGPWLQPSSAAAYVYPTNGLVYRVSFATPTNAAGVFLSDFPGGSNGLTRIGVQKWPTYDAVRKCVFFAGAHAVATAGDSIIYNTPATLANVTSCTFMAWVHPMALNSIRNFCGTGLNWRSQDGIETVFTTYRPWTYCALDSGIYHTAAGDSYRMRLHHWTHVALVQAGASITMYTNAVQTWTTNGVTAPITVTSADVGWGSRSVSSATWWWGWIDDTVVYSRALSQAELTALVAGTAKTDEAWTSTGTAVINYRFDSPGTNLYGLVVNTGAHRGHGCKNMEASYPAFGTNIIRCGAATGSINTQYAPNLSSNGIHAVTFWVQRKEAESGYIFGASGDRATPNTTLWRAYWSANGIVATVRGNGNSTYTATAATAALSLDTWVHVGIVIDGPGDRLRVYLNSSEAKNVEITSAGDYDFTSDYFHCNGYTAAAGPVSAWLDDFRIYANAASTNVVGAAYADGRSN